MHLQLADLNAGCRTVQAGVVKMDLALVILLNELIQASLLAVVAAFSLSVSHSHWVAALLAVTPTSLVY